MEAEKISMDIQPDEYQKLNSRQFGNHHLYSKTSLSVKWNDPRLKVLQPNYFYNKNVLDIGCNEGILTIPIAIKYQPQMIKGIDIDRSLIKKCNKNLDKFANKCQQKQQCLPKHLISKIQQLPILLQQRLPTINTNSRLQQQIITQIPQIQFKNNDGQQQYEEVLAKFPNNIVFQTLNVLAPTNVEYYDTVLCMNVTKWLHLALGDQAVNRLFGNVSSMLHQGGILIMEAQPWNSYRKKKNLQKSYRENYQKISYKPQKFTALLKSFGLFHTETIQASADNNLKHNISIYQKKGFYCSDLVL